MKETVTELPSRGFAKLDSGIVDSTIWMKPHDALRVWIALLAKSDSYGIVRIASPALAHQCFVTPERLAEIISDFCSPDPDSRSPNSDGRRLQPIEGGWTIINYLRYRDMMQRKSASHAERQAKYREKLKVRDSRVTLRVTSDTEAESRGRGRSRGKLPPLPPSLVTPEFEQAWADWIAYRRESKFSAWKPVTVKAKLAELEAIGSEAATAAIRRSIANGWKGIFPENGNGGGGKASHDCDRCAGKGFIEKPDEHGGWSTVKHPCKRCQGTGKF